MNLLSPRTLSLSPFQAPGKCSLSLSLSHSPLAFLHFHGVMTGANGANTEVTGAALVAAGRKTKVALQLGDKKGCHATLIDFPLSAVLFWMAPDPPLEPPCSLSLHTSVPEPLRQSGAACKVNRRQEVSPLLLGHMKAVSERHSRFLLEAKGGPCVCLSVMRTCIP